MCLSLHLFVLAGSGKVCLSLHLLDVHAICTSIPCPYLQFVCTWACVFVCVLAGWGGCKRIGSEHLCTCLCKE